VLAAAPLVFSAALLHAPTAHTTELVHAAGADGFFRIEKSDGIWWWINPAGEPFFSVGINYVHQGPSEEGYDADRPCYAAFRYYDSPEKWANDTVTRLREWRFNTLGAWCDPLLHESGMPYVRVLHFGKDFKVPWTDIFSQEFERIADKLAAELVAPYREDKTLLGWCTDNEIKWFTESLLISQLRQPKESSTRKRLIALLREHYGHDFSKLSVDFVAKDAENFEQLAAGGHLCIRPGGAAHLVANRFIQLVSERYYKVVCEAIRRHDPNHLILGDRYHGYCPDVVVATAAKYVDVVTTNYDWPIAADGYLPTQYLRRLHQLTGKPVLITEHYVAAIDNRSGNPNTGGIFTTVKDQDERARVFEYRLRTLVNEPYIIGTHWFTYADEPPHGRPIDGEDYNFGTVDIENKPYELLTTAMTRSHGLVHQWHSNSIIQKRATLQETASHSEPIRVARLTDTSIKQVGDRLRWHTNSAIQKSTTLQEAASRCEPIRVARLTDTSIDQVGDHLWRQSKLPPLPGDDQIAEMLVAWDADYLWLTVLGNHFVDKKSYMEPVPSMSEGLTWNVSVNEATGPIKIRMVNGQSEVTAGRTRLAHRHRGVRHQTTVGISPQEAGQSSWKAGDIVSLRSTLRDQREQSEITWDLQVQLYDEDKDD